MVSETTELQGKLEARIRDLDPEIELIAVERPAGESLRLFIDHPAGVDLGLCERVTGQLRDLLASYSLEVSSPGQDRPLTKPEHFRRFVGRRIRVKTAELIAGRRSFTGTLAEADGQELQLDAPEGQVTIPLAGIRRSNLVPEASEGMPETNEGAS